MNFYYFNVIVRTRFSIISNYVTNLGSLHRVIRYAARRFVSSRKITWMMILPLGLRLNRTLETADLLIGSPSKSGRSRDRRTRHASSMPGLV